MGLPLSQIKESDRPLLEAGNEMYMWSTRYVRAHVSAGGRGYLENPAQSLLWATKGMQALLNEGIAWFADAHSCAYGTPHRKATRFLLWGVPQGSVQLRKCRPTGKICSTSKQPHFVLTGMAEGGQFATNGTEEYSSALAEDLISQLLAQ